MLIVVTIGNKPPPRSDLEKTIMTIPLPLKFMGAPGSPYTRKMMALLRYRRLPYEFLIGDQAARRSLPQPKVALLPTFFLPGESGEIEAVVDSTPLIRRFEKEFDGRAVVPPDPVLGFLNYLLEDYADEWLTKAMFHYRWHYQRDIDRAGSILPLWRDISQAPATLERRKAQIVDRQVSRLYVVGSNDTTAPVIEASYTRFLGIFDALLQRRPFLLGERPGSADFAVYAQLTQLARFDPTPSEICLGQAPRVYAWTDLMDDLSGAEAVGGWLARACRGGGVAARAALRSGAGVRSGAAGERHCARRRREGVPDHHRRQPLGSAELSVSGKVSELDPRGVRRSGPGVGRVTFVGCSTAPVASGCWTDDGRRP